jgi:hypothetical protein
MKKLAVTALTNQIVLANVNEKTKTISGDRTDMTDEAIRAVSEHMMNFANENQDSKGFWQFEFEGFGTLTWESEKKD